MRLRLSLLVVFVSVGSLFVTPAQAVSLPTRIPPAPSVFRWPLDGSPAVVRGFDPPPQPWLPGHRGVDLAAPPGAVVRSGDGARSPGLLWR